MLRNVHVVDGFTGSVGVASGSGGMGSGGMGSGISSMGGQEKTVSGSSTTREDGVDVMIGQLAAWGKLQGGEHIDRHDKVVGVGLCGQYAHEDASACSVEHM